jgi:hypothetical protein
VVVNEQEGTLGGNVAHPAEGHQETKARRPALERENPRRRENSMKIQAVDMTTPLNVEMLKQLKETLTAINDQYRYHDYATATPGSIAHSEALKQSATTVMRAITLFCTPMMVCDIPGDNEYK